MEIPLKTIRWIELACVIFLTPLVAGHLTSEARVRKFLDHPDPVMATPMPSTPEQMVARIQSRLQINALGGQPAGGIGTSQVMAFLENPPPDLQGFALSESRIQALRLLGRLEDPVALPILETEAIQHPSSFAKISLARVQSHDLHGRARLEFIANSIGLSWDDMVRMSEKVNDWYHNRYGQCEGEAIIDEMTDVLCSMADRGENVESFVALAPRQGTHKRIILTLGGGHRLLLDWTLFVRVQAAPLQEEAEIRFLLDRLGEVDLMRSDEYRLTDYIIGLGSKVPGVLIEKLDEMARHPQQYYGLKPIPNSKYYRSALGLDAVMLVCKSALDPTLMAKLGELQNDGRSPALSSEAKKTLESMQSDYDLLHPPGVSRNMWAGQTTAS